MLTIALGLLVASHCVLGFPRPGPVASPGPMANPGPYGGYGYGYGYGHGHGCGCGCQEVIVPPVCPPVLNTVDVYDIATLGVIPAPAIEYVYPAVGYEAFGLGDCGGRYGYAGGYGYY